MSWRSEEGCRDRLIGARVAAFTVQDGEECAWLTTDRGVYELATFADCCSETWWADAVGVKQMIGAVVTAIEDIEMPDEDPRDGRSRQEFDELYGIRITTDRGACDLIYRNSSNGYYGGDSVERWREPGFEPSGESVAQDWSA